MKIGPYVLDNNLFLAPMAGVTDLPFRRLCKELGAGVVVSEMVTSDPLLQNSRKTRLRLAQDYTDLEQNEFVQEKVSCVIKDKNINANRAGVNKHRAEPGVRVVQIAGGDAEILAQAAVSNVAKGAQVIDINMGCPAKKVCKKAAGSALLKDPKLVQDILNAVVKAVDVPVTLKIRTGWDKSNKNALLIAKMAEDSGIQLLAIHGRTRECKYKGEAEYETVAEVKQSVSIPIIANGDITSPEKAKQVLDFTGADGLMVGRAAQGRPWIFREIEYFLTHGKYLPAISENEIATILVKHIEDLHQFYGEYQGVRIARKHTSWYLNGGATGDLLEHRQTAKDFSRNFNQIRLAEEQLVALAGYFKQ